MAASAVAIISRQSQLSRSEPSHPRTSAQPVRTVEGMPPDERAVSRRSLGSEDAEASVTRGACDQGTADGHRPPHPHMIPW